MTCEGLLSTIRHINGTSSWTGLSKFYRDMMHNVRTVSDSKKNSIMHIFYIDAPILMLLLFSIKS